MNEPDTFPLIALQPVHAARQSWVALHWLATRPVDGVVLQRLLDTIPCIVPADPPTIDVSLA